MKAASAQRYFLLSFLLGVIVLSFFIIKPFLSPIVLGIVFAVVLYPLYTALVKSWNGRESLAALATVLMSIVIILVPLILIASQLLQEAQTLYNSVGTDTQQVFNHWVDQKGPRIDVYIPHASVVLHNFSSRIDEYSRAGASWLLLNIGVAFSSVAALLLDLFIFFVTLYYLLRDGARLKKYLLHFSPLKRSDDEHIVTRVELAVNSVVKGKLALALIQGVLASIGFILFGAPNPVLWGFVAMIASLIPPVGVGLVLVPTIGYLALASTLPITAGFALWSVGVAIVDNVLGPKLMGRGAELHPLLVLLSVLGGLVFFGPVGLFLGPIVFALLLALLSLYGFIEERDEAVSSVT